MERLSGIRNNARRPTIDGHTRCVHMYAQRQSCRSSVATSPQVAAVAKLGAVVMATFAVCWAPYLTSTAVALEVLQVGTCRTIPHTMHTVSLEDPSSLCMMLHRDEGLVASLMKRACNKGSSAAHHDTATLPTGDVACLCRRWLIADVQPMREPALRH